MRIIKLSIAIITMGIITVFLFPLSIISGAIIWLFNESIKITKEYIDAI